MQCIECEQETKGQNYICGGCIERYAKRAEGFTPYIQTRKRNRSEKHRKVGEDGLRNDA